VRRRAFGVWAGCVCTAGGGLARAQGSRPARIAWISGSSVDRQSPFLQALRSGLEELGRIEPRDYRLELYWGEESRERLDPLVAEMLRTAPDLVVTQGPVVFNVLRSRTALPVLFAFSGDPVEARLVDSLARPGRNLTGISMMALELVGKRMEALAEALPRLKQVAVITNPGHAGERGELAASRAAAAKLGLNIEYLPIQGENGIEASLAAALRARCQAIVVFPDAGMMRLSERIAEFAIQHRMPAVSGWAEFVRRGNVLSYGPNVQQVYRRLASYVDRVLRGARPADLPVELPTTIELAVNLRAARAMGLGIPQSLLLRADEVIE
jgi:putative tryptophan/tyrosine transport system substrate-binding protein